MTPRFSVIVPVYNVEEYLEKCVNSLTEQKFKNVEIILVDDGSPDKCPSMCDEFATRDSRIRVIHKENGGLVSARQAGCEKALGEYILNVDGDDWVTPHYFEEINKIVDMFNPDIICFGSIHVNKNKNEEHLCNVDAGMYDRVRMEKEIFPKLIENDMGESFSPSIWSKAIKRQLYSSCQMSINRDIKIGEDNACTKPALSKANNLYVLKKSLYCYRINQFSMTKSRKPFDWEGPRLIGDTFYKLIRDDTYDFSKQIDRCIVHYLFNVVVSQFNRNENYSSIKKDIIEKLNDEYYKSTIMRCEYNSKYYLGNISRIALKRKWLYLIYLFNKIKLLKIKKLFARAN